MSQYFLPIGAALSILCYLYLLWMYFVVKSPVLMRHPTALAIYKCIFELIFVQQYFWLPFVSTRIMYHHLSDSPPYFCRASDLAGLLAFITQFSLLASELCFLVISVDLRIAYTNPFSSFQQNQLYYAAYVILSALLSAILLIICGPQVYGIASEGIVWIQTKRISYGAEYYSEPNYPKFFLFYFLLILIYVYCLWANFQYYRSHTKGFSQTVSNRINIMQRSKRFTLSYLAYDTLTMLSEFMSFVNYYDSHALNSLPSYCYCVRGIFTLMIILYSNHEDLSWRVLNPFSMFVNEEDNDLVALEGLLMQPHLNAALRVELLYFTTKGIMHAARDYEANEHDESFASSSEEVTTHAAVHNQLHTEYHNNTPQYQQQQEQHINAVTEEMLGDETVIEESRCYSFDEHPTLGVRPSLIAIQSLQDDRTSLFGRASFATTGGTNGVTTRGSGWQRSSIQHKKRRSAPADSFVDDDAERGVAMRNTKTSTTTTVGGSNKDEDGSSVLVSELNRLQAMQGVQVTQEVEEAFEEYQQSRMSFTSAVGGDRELRTPVTNAALLQQSQLQKAETEPLLRSAKTGDLPPSVRWDHSESSTSSSSTTTSKRNNTKSSLGAASATMSHQRGSLWSQFSHKWLFGSTSPSNGGDAKNRDTAADVEFSIKQPSNHSQQGNQNVGNSVMSGSSAQRKLLSDFHQQQQQMEASASSLSRNASSATDASGDAEELSWQRVQSFVPQQHNTHHSNQNQSIYHNAYNNPDRSLSSAFYSGRFLATVMGANAVPAGFDPNDPIRSSQQQNPGHLLSRTASEDQSVRTADSQLPLDPARSNSSARERLVRVVQSALQNATIAAQSVLNPAFREFRFKDFAPRLFGQIRKMHGITSEEYAKSFESTCRERFTEGRSGAFMFYTANQRCIVKSTNQEDIFALRDILPAYVRYLQKSPNSLLVRFVGAHCITMYGVDIYFTVMLNMFPPDQKAMSERYDLKGSWVNRHGNVRTKGSGGPKQQKQKGSQGKGRLVKEDRVHGAPLLQDNDFLQRISLRPETARALSEQIRQDVLFLRENGRMDYSLLIGVRRERFRVSSLTNNNSNASGDRPSDSFSYSFTSKPSILGQTTTPAFVSHHLQTGAEDPFLREVDGSFRAYMVEGPGLYYIGMIDLLQGWTLKKRLERFAKTVLQGKDGDGLSAMAPDDYAVRFYRRCVVDVFDHLEDSQMAELTWTTNSNGSNGSVVVNDAAGSASDAATAEAGSDSVSQLSLSNNLSVAHSVVSGVASESLLVSEKQSEKSTTKSHKSNASSTRSVQEILLEASNSIHHVHSNGNQAPATSQLSDHDPQAASIHSNGHQESNTRITNTNTSTNTNTNGNLSGFSERDSNVSSSSAGREHEAEEWTNSMRITAVVSPLAPHVRKQMLQGDYV